MTWTKTFIGVLAFFSLHQAETPLDTKHHVVFGSVVDKVSGEPLSSVYIYAVRGEEEASTDAKGEFRFKSWQSLPIILPCYLMTVIPAPYFKKWGKHPGVKAVVDGITAATIGAIAGAVVVLGKRQISDFLLAAIAIATAILLLRFRKFPEPYIIVVAALLGLILKVWAV